MSERSSETREGARGAADGGAGTRDAADLLRAQEMQRAADTIEGQLKGRDVRVNGDESPEELADLLTAVQEFERVVAALGADSMTNAPDSRYPDDRRLVLPERNDDESARAYMQRVRVAAEGLRPR